MGPTQISTQVGTWVPSLEVKHPVRDVARSPPSNSEVKNECGYTSTPPYAFITWAGEIFLKTRVPIIRIPLLYLLLTFKTDKLE
jgi:hypothetical protein